MDQISCYLLNLTKISTHTDNFPHSQWLAIAIISFNSGVSLLLGWWVNTLGLLSPLAKLTTQPWDSLSSTELCI
jgi:hypothetical protein